MLGIAGAALVARLAPPLTASVGQTTGSATPGGRPDVRRRRGASGGRARADSPAPPPDATHTVAVHLGAPVTVGAVVLAVVLAITGGLIAGCFGGWRAARLRPAAALSRVE